MVRIGCSLNKLSQVVPNYSSVSTSDAQARLEEGGEVPTDGEVLTDGIVEESESSAKEPEITETVENEDAQEVTKTIENVV
jgi:hypothetical protein